MNVNICTDCLTMVESGWDEKLIGRPVPDPVPMSLLTGAIYGSVSDADLGSFSWRHCDGCGSTLGGVRYAYEEVGCR